MKKSLVFALIAVAASCSVEAAEMIATINNVHLSCKGCVQGAEQAVGAVPGSKATVLEALQKAGLAGRVAHPGVNAASSKQASSSIEKE